MLVTTARATPPLIEFQPKSQSVVLYQQAALGVIASGTQPLFYQWRKNGVAISGATNDQIIIAQAQFPDEGKYSVIVSNRNGMQPSAEVELKVRLPASGDVDCSFPCRVSIDGAIHCVALQTDGKILIGGSFSTADGAVRNGIARLNPDGTTTDYNFMNGLSGVSGGVVPRGDPATVYAIAIQSDGKMLIGGNFLSVHGNDRWCLARLNADGSLDGSFLNGLASYSLLKDKLADVLASLAERERKVLELRFGLIDGYQRTLEEVGKQYKVTRERIRQIEAKALRKLRHPTRVRQLRASTPTQSTGMADG